MKVINVIREIHRGGFGIIEEVVIEDGTHLARKTFEPLMKAKMSAKMIADFKRRFAREVRIQEKLPNDFFIPILHSNLDDEDPWFLMPISEKVYIDEVREVRQRGKQPEGLSDILNSLEFLHDLGLTHRDLKPGNILFHDGKWKLADLGLITSDSEYTSSFFTSDGFAAGSELYMAPEQHTSFSSVSRHADIYSFGAILHDIFDGSRRVPFRQLSSKGRIGVIIEKCTDIDYLRRFDNVGVLRNVLLTHLTELESKEIITEDVSKWLEKLKDVDSWNEEVFDSFVIYLENNNDSQSILLRKLNDDFFNKTYKIDKVYWKRFALNYLKWMSNTSFTFDYCDVLIGHVFKIYEMTNDLEIKSNCVIGGSELGRYHNRWYVMKLVVKMASPDISDNLAHRIAIEIHVGGSNVIKSLKACTNQIKVSLDEYHEIIRKALDEE